ncbi:MAG: ComEA family DNA-binding protein [Bacteriovoracia bacterium]
MKKLYFFLLALSLPLIPLNAQVMDDDSVLGEDIQEEQQRDIEGKVIETESRVIDQESAELPDKQRQEGKEEVQYQAKKKITQTLLKEEKIPTIQVCETKANINEMDAQDFQALGFDKNTAQKIVQQRQERGAFKSVEDLSKIQGVSPEQFSTLKPDLSVGGAQAQEEK